MRHFSPSSQLTLTTHHKKHCKTSLQRHYAPLVHATPINYFYSNLVVRNWFYSLPFQRLQALLTLFSKSFSPFPHGTCLLSVSSRYLALEEDYLPFSAPLPKYATLNDALNVLQPERQTGFSPSLTLSSKKTYVRHKTSDAYQDYNSATESRGFTL